MSLTYHQLNHLINLHVSLRKMYSYSKLEKLSFQEASDLIIKLRAESNEKLKENYSKYYGREPHPSELWRTV